MAYNACNAIILQTDSDLSAAEAHGMATGMLCVNARTDSGVWLAELFGNNDAVLLEKNQLLIRLFEETRRLMASDEFDFELLLPDDDTPLVERVEALRNWCRGFLFGVGSGVTKTGWSKEAREILKDISEFTKLDGEAEGEDDEQAFVEIYEYLRSAVLLLGEDLGNNNDDNTSLWRES